MREPGRDPQLPVVLAAELDADPRPKVGEPRRMSTATSNTRPARHAHQLALRMRRLLPVQAAQHAARRAGVVVLHEARRGRPTGLAEAALVEALEEEAPRIAEDPRLQDEHVGDAGGSDVHAGAEGEGAAGVA